MAIRNIGTVLVAAAEVISPPISVLPWNTSDNVTHF